MARHRRTRGRRQSLFPVIPPAIPPAREQHPGPPVPDLPTAAAPARRQRGTHRLPRPTPALRGRALTTAVAAGALVVAGNSLPVSTASTTGVTDIASVGLASTAEAEQVASVAQAPLPDRSGPTPEVARITPVSDPQAEIVALGRAVERAEREAVRAATLAAYEEAVRNRVGKSYTAGNNHSLDGWIAKALGVLGLPQALAPGVKKVIMHESTGNPNAINNWDRNAMAGTPSQGLMQTIPATYRACVHPSLRHRPITDPVANITAGLRSMITHHGIDAVINGGRRDAAGRYIGYGGHGCAGYDLSKYEAKLRQLWTDEPLPDSDLARGVPPHPPPPLD